MWIFDRIIWLWFDTVWGQALNYADDFKSLFARILWIRFVWSQYPIELFPQKTFPQFPFKWRSRFILLSCAKWIYVELTTRLILLSMCACCNASRSTLLRNGNEIELRRSPLPPDLVGSDRKVGSLPASEWRPVGDGDGSGDLRYGLQNGRENNYLNVKICVAMHLFCVCLKTYESSATAICVCTLSNLMFRRSWMLPLDDDGVATPGGGGSFTNVLVLGCGFRKRFRRLRWGRISLEPILLSVLPAFFSEMLFNFIVGNELSSANGMTPLSRRFDLL